MAHTREGLQRKADIKSAFTTLFDMEISVGQLRLAAFGTTPPMPTVPTPPDAIIIHSAGWTSETVNQRCTGTIKMLMVLFDINGHQASQIAATKLRLQRVCNILMAQRAVDNAALTATISILTRAAYTAQFSPWPAQDLADINVPLNKLYRRISNNMPNFANALLYLPATSGGLCLPRTYTNARKWSMAQRALTSDKDAAEAVGEHLQREARFSGSDPIYGATAIIGPVSINPAWGESQQAGPIQDLPGHQRILWRHISDPPITTGPSDPGTGGHTGKTDWDRPSTQPWTHPTPRADSHYNGTHNHSDRDRLLRQRVPPGPSSPETDWKPGHCPGDHPRHAGGASTTHTPWMLELKDLLPPENTYRVFVDGSWRPATPRAVDDYLEIGGTHEGGGSIVITHDHENWRTRLILVIAFHTPCLPPDLGGLHSIMELLAITGGLEVLGLTGTIHSDCQGLIRKLLHPHVLRRNTTGPGYPLLRYCVNTIRQHPIQICWTRSHAERSNVPPNCWEKHQWVFFLADRFGGPQ